MINYTELVEMLPDFFARIAEYPEIMKAWAQALSVGEANIDQLWKNLYIQTCDEGTILYWENLLGLVSDPGDTLQARRNRIINTFTLTRPYTERLLRARLDEMFGENNYTLTIDPVAQTCDMVLHRHIDSGMLLFCDMWFRIAPAHIAMTVSEDNNIDGQMYIGGVITQSKIVRIG